MNANEIQAGKNYIIKIGNNEVKVKVINQTGRSWVVKTTSGKIMPVHNVDRFVRLAEPAPAEVQAPAEPPKAKSPAPTDKPDRKLSMLDAAVEVLKGVSYPMSARELIAAMEKMGLWKSGKGLTPANTLSASLNREIAGKEKPRFQKAGKGMFSLVVKVISEDKR